MAALGIYIPTYAYGVLGIVCYCHERLALGCACSDVRTEHEPVPGCQSRDTCPRRRPAANWLVVNCGAVLPYQQRFLVDIDVNHIATYVPGMYV